MDLSTPTSRFIQDFIFNKLPSYFNKELEYPLPFYVHVSLIKTTEKRLNEMFPIGDFEINAQILQVGTKCFEMYLVIVSRGTYAQLRILRDFIIYSTYSFLLEDNPNLFIEAPLFDFMKKFLRDQKLEANILSIEEKLAITTDHVKIKVVTFNKNVNPRIIIEHFEKMLLDIGLRPYYYVLWGFPWEKSPIIHINEDVYSVFPIILQRLGTLNYENNLNIMDLISLRLALCNVFQVNCIKVEIDFLIRRELSKTVQNHHFDIYQYLIDKNYKDNPLLTNYLIYEFQNCFQTINYEYIEYSSYNRLISMKNIATSIDLKEETDVLDKITNRSNVDYTIDGIGFEMRSALFCDLLKSPNILEIKVDTNYQWINDAVGPNRIVADRCDHRILISLYGENRYNCADDCIAEVKKFNSPEIRLRIYCKLNDYGILDNLLVNHIQISNTKISTDMLHQMYQSNIKSYLWMSQCSIEPSFVTWKLFNNLKELRYTQIIEDEGTWPSIFEFVARELRRTNSKKFQFQKYVQIVNSEHSKMHLHEIRFTIEEQESKLEIRDIKNNRVVDLYNRKFNIEPDDKSEFEFYQ